ncbi:Oligomerization domain-containing protein [Mortierella sp. GBAus27b]|nr:hypothetical protein BGX31_010664 [Mortierella sp. GBA43]KAI8352214.1 Oligomerization domain-containing protein [Mortierella sp. GBAus27b]
MWSSSFYRSSRALGSLASQNGLPRFSQLAYQRLSYPRVLVVLDSRIPSSGRYHTTPVLFSKYERHHDHPNINKIPLSTSSSASELASTSDLEFDDIQEDRRLLTATDDFMVGNEGLETIDPKDFPELYPSEEDMIEGLSQESHPDDERDFEASKEDEEAFKSVLLSDKKRSEEEFSWFVDESYSDRSHAPTDTDTPPSTFESDFIPLWQMNAQRTSLATGQQEDKEDPIRVEHNADSVVGLVKMIESERGKNVKVIDMRDKCDWTNWMVIAEGLSERHLGNLADQIYTALKKSSPMTNPPVMEGRDTSDWIVIDAGSVVIHFMTPDARSERDLEGLWASVKNPLKLKDAEQVSWDDVKGQMAKSWKESPGRSRGEDGKRGRRGERDIPLSEVVGW